MWRYLALGGVILLYRYTLRLATPRGDWWYVIEYTGSALRWLRIEVNMLRVWLIGLARYTPPRPVREAWEYLRARLVEGAYGRQGT